MAKPPIGAGPRHVTRWSSSWLGSPWTAENVNNKYACLHVPFSVMDAASLFGMDADEARACGRRKSSFAPRKNVLSRSERRRRSVASVFAAGSLTPGIHALTRTGIPPVRSAACLRWLNSQHPWRGKSFPPSKDVVRQARLGEPRSEQAGCLSLLRHGCRAPSCGRLKSHEIARRIP